MAVFAPDPALHFTDAAGGYGDMSAVVLCCSSSSSSSSSTSSSSSSSSSPSSDRHHVSASSSTLRSRCSLSSPSGRHYHARDHGQDGDLLCKQLHDVVVDVAEHVGWQQDRVHELCVIPVPPTGVRSRQPPLMKMTIKSPSKFDGTRQLPSFSGTPYPLPYQL